jgi:phosphoglycolate phosphatase
VGVAPAEAIYVGDTVDDVQMGKTAGALTAGVATGFSPWEALADAAPTYLCRSLREVAPVLLGRPDAGGQEA